MHETIDVNDNVQRINSADQREIIMDWIYEEGHDFFSVYDLDFWTIGNRAQSGSQSAFSSCVSMN